MAENPFFPGYYPGQPFIRPPRGGRGVKPPEFSPGTFDTFIDSLNFTDSDFIDFPNWLKERVVADWKTSMKASAGSNYSAEELEVYGDQAELPGASGISFNLNPQDWIKDPQGTALKIVSGWKDDVFTYEDVDTRFKTALYKAALGNGAPKAFVSSAAGSFAREALTRRDMRGVGGAGVSDIGLMNLPNPVLAKIGGARLRVGVGAEKAEVDVYGNVALAIEKFVMNSKSGAGRDDAHDEAMRRAHFALRTELEQRFNIQLASTTLPDKINELAGLTIAGIPAGSDLQFGAKRFITQSYIADAMAATGDAFDDTTKALSQLSLLAGAGDVNKVLFKERKDAAGNVIGLDSIYDGLRDKLRKNVDEAENALTAAKSLLDADASVKAEFIKSTARYEKFLDKLKKDYVDKPAVWDILTKASPTAAERALLGAHAKGLYRSLRDFGGNFSGGDIFAVGAGREYLRKFLEDGLLARKSSHDFGHMLDLLGPLEGGRRLRVWMHRLRIEREREEMDDLLQQVLKGGTLKTYLWGRRIKTKFDGLTPAYFTGVLLKKVHYFGLVIGDVKENTPTAKFLDVFGIFKHSFTVDVPNIGSIRLTGSKHLAVAKTLATMVKGGELPEDLLKLMWSKSLAAGDARTFATAISVNPAFAGYTLPGKDLEKLYEELKKLEQYLAAHKLSAADIANLDRFAALIKMLGKRAANLDLFDITKRYIGLLQGVAQWLNVLQTKFLNAFGKFIAPFAYLKLAIAETISDAVAALFAGMTGGTGTFLAGIVRFITRFVVKQTLDFLEAVGRALIGGNVVKLFGEIEKNFITIIRWLVWFSLIPIAVIVLVVFTMGAVISTISPSNIAKGGDFKGAGKYTLAPGAVGSCPMVDFRITARSFAADDLENGGRHGSNTYWKNAGEKACSYAIPYMTDPGAGRCPASGASACGPADASGSICSSKAPLQDYYGFAMDVVSRSNDTVYLPKIVTNDGLHEVREWSVGPAIPVNGGCWGYGVIASATDGVNSYKMFLAHITNISGGTLGVEAPVGTLFYTGAPECGFNENRKHVHIELMINGEPVRPEDYLCL